MPNVPDNEMEHFFRESADNYEIEFNPAAWEKMEKKLDKENRKVFWWRIGILLPLGLLLLIGSFFLVLPLFSGEQGNEVVNKLPIQEQEVLSDSEKQKQDGGTTLTDKKGEPDKTGAEKDKLPNKNTNNDDNRKQIDKGSENGESGNSLADDDALKTTTPTDDGVKDLNTSTKNTTSTPEDKVNKGTDAITDDKLPIIPTPEKEKQEVKNSTDEKDRNELESNDPLEIEKEAKRLEAEKLQLLAKQEEEVKWEKLLTSIDHLRVKASVLTAFMAKKEKLSIQTTVPDSTEAVKPKRPRERSLYLNFSLSPDLSGVDNVLPTSGLRGGAKSGLLLEYQPFERWSFFGGAYLAKKRYSADHQEYTVPTGFWTNGEKPIGINANCNVLEIPIGLRYQWLKRSNNSLFLGASLSSYLLLREEYTYDYEHNDPALRQGWLGKNESKHWFGVSTFSLGYEKKLGNRTAFQLEPYIQLPLSGVGFGKVNLVSYGAYFTLKYRIK